MDQIVRLLRRLSAAGTSFISLFKRATPPPPPPQQPLYGGGKGPEGDAIEAFAFAGGGFDAIMELGVVHSLIVREHLHPDQQRLPHAFSGVSAGAVIAAVASDVLGQEFNNPNSIERTSARISRLRQMLQLFLEAPFNLIASLFPDLYEVKSGRPLKALDLPVHSAEERRDRNDAIEARAGVITLINGALETSLPLSAVVRTLRLVLGARTAREELSRFYHECRGGRPRLSRLWKVAYELWRLLLDGVSLSVRFGGALSETLLRLYFLHLAGALRLVRDAFDREIGDSRPLQFARRLLFWLGRSATDVGTVLSIVRLETSRAWWWFTRLMGIVLWYGVLVGVLSGAGWHALSSLLSRGADLLLWTEVPWAVRIAPAMQDIVERAAAFQTYPHIALLLALSVSGAIVLLWVPLWILEINFSRSFLRALGLDRDLLSDYEVRRFLIHVFDPNYYGGSEKHDSIVARALRGDGASDDSQRGSKRTLWDLSRGDRLHVAPAVVDITKGGLEILQDTRRDDHTQQLARTNVPVVDALLASISRVPLLRAQKIDAARRDSYYIDASNIASEPLNGLMDYLRDRVSPAATHLTVYAVTPFPVTTPTRSEKDEPLLGAARVMDRVRDLRRFQIAKVDRQLTKVYTNALKSPSTRAVTEIPSGTGRSRRYLSAEVIPVETPEPLRVYRDLLKADGDTERRAAMLRAVAEGCHASMLVFEKAAIENAWDGGLTKPTCPGLFARPSRRLVLDNVTGLPEICSACKKEFVEPAGRARVPKPGAASAMGTAIPAASDASHDQPAAAAVEIPPETAGAKTPEANDKPWSVVVLSGGVFRGVFQVGVVAGSIEACVEPRLLVGSSVGSLMMTAAAKIWADRGATPSESRGRRRPALRTLAATFLALDQLVMTDRFADFVRRITLRAGFTNVSIKDVDRAVRTYAELGSGRFSHNTRQVLAAFERLLYVTPFELLELVRAGREERWHHVRERVLDCAQNFLDRSGVRDEVLGADPLRLLIDALGTPGGKDCVIRPQFDCYQPHLYRLVTATNLQAGSLEIFGMGAASGRPTDASFTETLLASGAFPVVFRPRLQSDLQPTVADFAQYTDGGVMDNLPLYSVAEFISDAAKSALTVRRPRTAPHLVITGSLEPEFRKKQLFRRSAEYWPSVQDRVARIAYNTRPLGFAETQDNLESIFEYQTNTLHNASAFQPVRMRLSVIRAQWLCDTFGFHPMLGFSRVRQAKSIAHGCASTLAYLAGEYQANPEWGQAWGLDVAPNTMQPHGVSWADDRRKEYLRGRKEANLPIDDRQEQDLSKPAPQPTLRAAPQLSPPRRDGRKKGTCWFRKEAICPFSKYASAEGEDPDQVRWLHVIYRTCGQSYTHIDRD